MLHTLLTYEKLLSNYLSNKNIPHLTHTYFTPTNRTKLASASAFYTSFPLFLQSRRNTKTIPEASTSISGCRTSDAYTILSLNFLNLYGWSLAVLTGTTEINPIQIIQYMNCVWCEVNVWSRWVRNDTVDIVEWTERTEHLEKSEVILLTNLFDEWSGENHQHRRDLVQ